MKQLLLLFGIIFLFMGQGEKLSAATEADSVLTAGPISGLLHADTATVPLRSADETTNPVWRVLWITVVLLAFLLAGMLAYKKFVLKGSITRSSHIAILARQPVAPKQSILIVRIEDKKYALGATDHSLNVIAELGLATTDETGETGEKPANLFGDVLKKITKR